MVKGKETTSEDFSQENVPNSNWVKFEKIGDYAKGTFVERTFKKGLGDFKDQQVYSLVNAEVVTGGKKLPDKEFNLGVSSNYVNDKFKNIVPGQRIGLKFEKEIPAKIKGHHNAKSLLPNLFGIDPEFKGKEEFKQDVNFEE